ncbi:MAG: Nif3-like dinuclear metal center hexameric protein [Myxococcota bacterium]
MARSSSSSPRLDAVVAALDAIAPPTLAADWDNVGLLVGHRERRVSRALFTIDLMPAVVDEAIERKVQLVVAYHPPIFRPLKRLVRPSEGMEAGVVRCLEKGIAIYSPHTALDAAVGGTNDVLAAMVGVANGRPIVAAGADDGDDDDDDPRAPTPRSDVGPGLGRVGPLRKPTTLGQLAKRTKRQTGARCVAIVGAPRTPIRRAIIGVGAAGSMLFEANPGFGDVLVTGELRHHDALRVQRRNATAIVLSHWSSERPALRRYADTVATAVPALSVHLSEADAEPFARV